MNNYPQGYGKRPLWFWILVYIVIGGAIYAGIYYFYAHRGTTSSTTQSPY